MALDDVVQLAFIDVIGVLYHVALYQNRNAVFIRSVEMCFIFVEQINVIFIRPLSEAIISCDCIINVHNFMQLNSVTSIYFCAKRMEIYLRG